MEDFESIRRITTVLGNIDEASAKAGLEPRLVFRPERGDPFRPMIRSAGSKAGRCPRSSR